MASVYLAEDTVLQETEVAIKILSDVSEGIAEHRSRFIQEVKLTRKIQHENVVRTFDYGQDGDLCFYSMEHLRGVPLSDIMARGVVELRAALSIASQLMRGLAAIQGVGVIHRDLKPSNILISDQGIVTITDFGIARGESSKLTLNPTQVLGTIAYIAPEVLTGSKASRAVDFYALGVVLYELLAGCQPFEEENPARLIVRKVEQDPISIAAYRPDLPGWLITAIMGLLARDPAERMSAVRDFAKALESCEDVERTKSLSRQLDDTVANCDLPQRPWWSLGLARQRGSKLLSLPVLLATLFSLLALPIATTDVGSRIEDTSLRALFQWRGSVRPPSEAVIVAIDEQSYTNLGVPFTSPWPRALHARLLHALGEAGARLVVFDVLFTNSGAEESVDDELASAMRRVPTILGAALGMTHKATMQGSFILEEMIRPAALFEDASAGIGTIGLPLDAGRARRFMTHRSEVFPDVPSLAEAAVKSFGAPAKSPGSRDLINFYGPSRTIPTISFETVIHDLDRLPEDVFKDKIVFVGLGLRSSTGPSQRDSFETPYDEGLFGTELHATAALNILHREWLRGAPPLVHALALLVITAAIIWSLVSLPGVVAILAISVISAAAVASQLALFILGFYLPLETGLLWGCFVGSLLRILSGAQLSFYRGRGL
jgi:serine/threonine protein kinase